MPLAAQSFSSLLILRKAMEDRIVAFVVCS
jgi:hypothetical protein